MTNNVHEIHIKNLSKRFGNSLVLNGLNAVFSSDSPTVIVGPSGCGKSTLLRIMAGLEKPDEGEIIFDNKIMSTSDFQMEPRKRNLGFVFQTPALWPNMTVLGNVMFGLEKLGKNEKVERAKHYLEKVGALHLFERYPSKLSGGEARRVSLARALAGESTFLFMDEPLVNLDYELKQSIFEFIIEEYKANKPCLVYVTHDFSETGDGPFSDFIRLTL